MAGISQFDPQLFVKILPSLAYGAYITVKLTSISILLGLILGTILGMGRISKNPLFFSVSTSYVEFIRGTPLLVQIMIVYYGLPAIGLNLPAEPAGILALTLNSGAYIAEIIRAGIQSVPRGQMEAARSLGDDVSAIHGLRHISPGIQKRPARIRK